jgi:putative addiction module component (TIGR02574 family)
LEGFAETTGVEPPAAVALDAGRVSKQIPVMTRPALLTEILDLPPAERLRLVEDIWDSLTASVSDVPVPDWHREELDARLADPSEHATVSVDELQARLRGV